MAHTNRVSKLRAQLRLRITSSLAHHYVMAKIVPVMQLAAHAKSSTLYGGSCGLKSKFFGLMGYYYFV